MRFLPMPLLLLAALIGQAAHADADGDGDGDGIVTDRPGLVESSDTVAPGRWQLEGGLSLVRDKADGLRLRERGTPLLLRVGLAEDWELRVETDGALRQTAGGERSRGWGDASVGLKWHWRDGDAERGAPGLAWLAHVDTDSGSAAFRGQGLRPSLRLTAEWELANDWSAGLIGGLFRDRNEAGKRYVGAIFGASVGWPVAEGWKGYAELAAEQIASTRNGGRQVSAGTGLSWLLDRNLQLDASVNRGLNRQTADWAWGLGISYRH